MVLHRVTPPHIKTAAQKKAYWAKVHARFHREEEARKAEAFKTLEGAAAWLAEEALHAAADAEVDAAIVAGIIK